MLANQSLRNRAVIKQRETIAGHFKRPADSSYPTLSTAHDAPAGTVYNREIGVIYQVRTCVEHSHWLSNANTFGVNDSTILFRKRYQTRAHAAVSYKQVNPLLCTTHTQHTLYAMR